MVNNSINEFNQNLQIQEISKKRINRKNSYISIEDRDSASFEKKPASLTKKRRSSSRQNKVDA